MNNFGFGGGGSGFPGQQPMGAGAFGGTRDMEDDMRPPSLPAMSFQGANNNGDVQHLASASGARSLDDPMSQFQLSNQLTNQLTSQLPSHLSSQFSSQLSSQLPDQYQSQLSSQLTSQLSSQYPSQYSSQLSNQLSNQLSSQYSGQLSSQYPSQLSNQLSSQLTSQLPGMGANNGSGGNVVAQCMVPGCERSVQANTIIDDSGGFCSFHFTTYLNMSNQLETWDCRCGNKVYGQNERCGICQSSKVDASSAFAGQSLRDANATFAGQSFKDTNSMFPGQSLKDSNAMFAGQNMKDTDQMFAGQSLKDTNSMFPGQNMKDSNSMFAGQGLKDTNSMLAGMKDSNSPFAETEMTTASAAAALGMDNKDNDLDMKPMAKGSKTPKSRETNTNGRTLCKEVGCTKLSQSQNDGYCRSHFNMYSAPKVDDSAEGGSSWTCACGNMVSVKKKRCGKCNKWRGGKREPYPGGSKKASGKASPHKKASSHKKKKKEKSPKVVVGEVDNAEWWICKCGDQVSSSKSRCGNCHHWRGGKRQGGWKIKSFGKSGVDDGIDWSQDWTCCEKVISSKKKRCGNCHGWRGGRRIASSKPSSSSSTKGKGSSSTWKCIKCDTMNPGSQKKCGSCRKSKKSGSGAATSPKKGAEGGADESAKYSVTEFI